MGASQVKGLGTSLESQAIKNQNSSIHFTIVLLMLYYSLTIFVSVIVLFNCVTDLLCCVLRFNIYHTLYIQISEKVTILVT